MPADPPTESPGPQLFVRLLHAPEWQRAGHPESHRLTPKDAALLAKLALDGPQSRDALCELLWPDSGPSKSADSLRQRASRLRAAAGVPLLQVGSTIELCPAVAVDAAAPEALSDEQLIDAPGLLAGVDLGDHDELDRWIVRARTRVAERCAKVLADRAEVLERDGRLHQALQLAGAIVRWLPLGEQGWRRLMRLHYLRGDPAAAQDVYWQLNGLLRDELGARPSTETQALYQTVETAQLHPAQSRRPVPVSLLRPPVIVGRNAPWAAMVAAWRAGQSFIVIGDGGLGKSRLLEAFAHDRPGLVAERARPGDAQLANALLARVLWAIEQRFTPAASDRARAELARLEPRFGVAPAAPGNEAVIRYAVERWLADAMSQGLRALVVDDLHNVDRGSLEMLRWLAASPVLVGLQFGFASRPWPEEAGCATLTAWLADSSRPVPVTLEPWSREELTELLATLALPVTLDERVVGRLYRHAGGHPFYTLATLQHAVANGVHLQDSLALQPPESVHRLLDARLRGLPADARGVLQLAAVGGADLSVERAARILGCAPLELSERWAALEANNVLRGETFSHDLVHDAALRCVPLGIRQALHRRWAALLEDEEPAAPHARVAWHWQQGLRPAAAACAWRRAAMAARRSGRLAEQAEQFENAARCHLEAGEPAAQCDALLDRLDGLHLWRGAAAVLAAVADVEPLATTSLQQLRCRIEKTEALIEQGLSDEAARQAQAALAATALHPEFEVEVRAQLAKALAQCEQADAALVQATRAMDAARASGAPLPTLKAANALMYVHWSAGRLADAVSVQREELASAEALGDRAVAAASEGSLAALLAAVGDVPGTYRHAREAHRRQLECGLSGSSVSHVLNHVVRGAAAAAFGRFDEALEFLRQAVEMAGSACPPPLQAKARLSLGGVLLVLGDGTAACEMAAAVPAAIGPGMQMQACWLRARAAELEGASAEAAWARFDGLQEAHKGLPFGQDATFEASYRGRAKAVINRLARARRDCLSLGLTGAARALQWRELVRWLELGGATATAAALACARELDAHASDGLSAKCYPPAVLVDIAQAYDRAGDASLAQSCRMRARQWVGAAVARVPDERKQSFLSRNPVNRSLW